MEKIKLDNFFNENPGREFPEYVSLSKIDCDEIAQSIQEKFSLKDATDGLMLVKAIDLLAKPCQSASHVGEDFDLNALLKERGIDAADVVYINWHRYDKLDKLKRSDLARHFYDIWYPDVDNIDVFDGSLDWILSMRHDGYIKLLRR
jgi:hypothetical protein